MIRILHTIDTTGPGGAETVFVNLAKNLDPLKFKSFAAITGAGWVCEELRKNNIEPIFLQSRGGFNLEYLLGLVKIIRRHKINLVQSHLFGSNLYCSIAGLICQIPVISTFHGFVDSNANDRLMGVKSWLINKGSIKIIFVSDRLREYFIREYGFSANKSGTIYNGVDTSVFRPQKDDSIRKELGLGPEHVLIGAVGNIRPAKGYSYFLKAAQLIHHVHPNSRFIIAGEGSGAFYENLLSLRKDLGLEESFFFLGFRGDAAKVLNNLDVFVLPSVSEGFSISTIEAMACGIPAVVTKCGGPEEIVQESINGIFVKPESEENLADALLMMVKNNSFRKEMINNGLIRVEKYFSNRTMLDRYSELYFRSN